MKGQRLRAGHAEAEGLRQQSPLGRVRLLRTGTKAVIHSVGSLIQKQLREAEETEAGGISDGWVTVWAEQHESLAPSRLGSRCSGPLDSSTAGLSVAADHVCPL